MRLGKMWRTISGTRFPEKTAKPLCFRQRQAGSESASSISGRQTAGSCWKPEYRKRIFPLRISVQSATRINCFPTGRWERSEGISARFLRLKRNKGLEAADIELQAEPTDSTKWLNCKKTTFHTKPSSVLFFRTIILGTYHQTCPMRKQ